MGCHPGISIEASGTISPQISVGGSISASFTAAYDSVTGASFGHSFTKSGHAEASLPSPKVTIGVSVVPQIAWRVDESPLEVHAGLPLGLTFAEDGCGVLVSASLSVEVGAGLQLFWDAVGFDFTKSWTVNSIPLFNLWLHNCAYWTGTIFYKAHALQTHSTGSWRFHTSATGTIKPRPDSAGSGNYPMPTSSTGAKVEKEGKDCGFNPVQSVIDEIDTDWQGPMKYYDETPGLTIKRVDGTGGQWLVDMPAIGTNRLVTAGHETRMTWSPDIFGTCHQSTDGPNDILEWEYQFTFLDGSVCGGVVCSDFVFKAPYGVMSASGKRTYQADASSPAYTFEFTLNKHCTIGKVC